MKKNISIFTIIITLLATVILSSYSEPKVKTIRGTIKSYGAEPMTFPGVTTTKGKEYLIVASTETKQELLARQGVLIEFTGFIIDDEENLPPMSLKDGAFKIETWQVIVPKADKKKGN